MSKSVRILPLLAAATLVAASFVLIAVSFDNTNNVLRQVVGDQFEWLRTDGMIRMAVSLGMVGLFIIFGLMYLAAAQKLRHAQGVIAAQQVLIRATEGEVLASDERARAQETTFASERSAQVNAQAEAKAKASASAKSQAQEAASSQAQVLAKAQATRDTAEAMRAEATSALAAAAEETERVRQKLDEVEARESTIPDLAAIKASQADVKRGQAERDALDAVLRLSLGQGIETTDHLPFGPASRADLLSKTLPLLLANGQALAGGGGIIYLRDTGSRELVLEACHNISDATKSTAARVQIGYTQPGRAAASGKIVFVVSATESAQFGHYCIPIRDSASIGKSEVLGVLDMHAPEGFARTDGSDRMMIAVADILAEALTRRRTEDGLQLAQQQLADLAGVSEDLAAEKQAHDTLRQDHEKLGRQVDDRMAELQLRADGIEKGEAQAKTIRDMAERSVQAKAEFVANMAQDLRKPLNSIIGFSGTIVKETHGPVGNSKYIKYAEQVHDTASQLLDLVRNVVDLSNSETGQVGLNPDDAVALGHYAGLSARLGKAHVLAEALFQRAIAADPANAVVLGAYSQFRTGIRRDHEQSDTLYQRALDADPENVANMVSYATFLWQVRKQFNQAQKVFRHAISLGVENPPLLASYAHFLAEVRNDYDEADALFQDALDDAPDDAEILGAYARFLADMEGDAARAEEFFQRAIDADPLAMVTQREFAAFRLLNGDVNGGMALLDHAALTLQGEDLLVTAFLKYAYTPIDGERADALEQLRDLLGQRVRCPSFDPAQHVARQAEDEHPAGDLLETLARVIIVTEDIEALDRFAPWQMLARIKPAGHETPTPANDETR